MRQANAKFERRFNGVEDKVKATSKDWDDFSLAELEAFWQRVKKEE
jgi:ATP diphosphatase